MGSKSAVEYTRPRRNTGNPSATYAAEATDTFGNTGEEEAKGHEVDEFYHQRASYCETDLDDNDENDKKNMGSNSFHGLVTVPAQHHIHKASQSVSLAVPPAERFTQYQGRHGFGATKGFSFQAVIKAEENIELSNRDGDSAPNSKRNTHFQVHQSETDKRLFQAKGYSTRAIRDGDSDYSADNVIQKVARAASHSPDSNLVPRELDSVPA